MDLLVLESRDDDPVIRSTLTGVSKAAPMAVDLRLQKTHSKDSMPGLLHSTTSTSLTSMQSTKSAPPVITTLDGSKDDKTMYPFRLKHLGKETYTLYAPSNQNREEWCNKIVEAKTKHAHALFAQNAEPFKLRVIADSAFSHDGPITGQRSIIIKGTPLDRAVREVEAIFVSSGRPGPVCRAKVNCATSFNQSGKAMVAVGSDIGVFVSELDNPRGWQKVKPSFHSCRSKLTSRRLSQTQKLRRLPFWKTLASSSSSLTSHSSPTISTWCARSVAAHPTTTRRGAPHKSCRAAETLVSSQRGE
jgi:hypothetical protein